MKTRTLEFAQHELAAMLRQAYDAGQAYVNKSSLRDASSKYTKTREERLAKIVHDAAARRRQA